MYDCWPPDRIKNRSYPKKPPKARGYCKTKEICLFIFEGRGFHFRSPNQSNVDIKKDAETDLLGKPNFIDFGLVLNAFWPSNTKPRRSSIDAKMPANADLFFVWSLIDFNSQFQPLEPQNFDSRFGKPHIDF